MAQLLTLDLGTTTGFVVGSVGHSISGTWSLKPSRYDGGGMRFVKFRARLDEIYSVYKLTHVFYEEVRRHAGTDAAHVYGGLMGTLTAWCEERGIPYRGLPVGTIKKHFTGNGNASKQAMIDECYRRGFFPKDDNEADAIAVFDLALSELGLKHPDAPPEEEATSADEKETKAA